MSAVLALFFGLIFIFIFFCFFVHDGSIRGNNNGLLWICFKVRLMGVWICIVVVGLLYG